MLVIFDCDGVLVDSEALACRIDAEFLTALGFPYTVQDIITQFVGVSLKDMTARIEAAHNRALPADFGERINKTLFARFEEELQPIPSVRDAILALPYARCVASSSTHDRIALSLRVTGLADLFANVFSATEVRHGKPAPDLFLHAASRMGASAAECLVIEDSPSGVRAACAAGMKVIGFVGGGHCAPGHADKLRDAGAPVIIERMTELPEMVRRYAA
ncbi:HAD family hydrolase [Microvirga rosea]|uniref:HAD family hydrolase n=1 Tax=Microvirga rosea TaxID=2715425 RepID=UPI001D09AF6E|nr:HAD family hydrolase [Microvirga rosea]MCB8820330.1 HAD family hydrolase [Microvirga rosea]